MVDGPAEAVAIADDCIVVDTAEGHFTFDSVYPALGTDTHTQLAEMVGARLGDDGCIGVDAHQRTSVPGVYAAGDVVIGLDQISHAMGEGGVAATTIRNDLAKDAAAAALGEEVGVEDDAAVDEVGDAGLERDQRAAAARRPRPRAGRRRRNSRPRRRCRARCPSPIDAGQADQVGVIIFALFERRQRGAVDLDQRAAQGLGGGAVGDALEAGDGALAVAADLEQAALDAADVDSLRGGRGCRRCR